MNFQRFAEDCPYQPTVGLNRKSSLSALRRGHKERFKGNGNLLGGCKKKGFK